MIKSYIIAKNIPEIIVELSFVIVPNGTTRLIIQSKFRPFLSLPSFCFESQTCIFVTKIFKYICYRKQPIKTH